MRYQRLSWTRWRPDADTYETASEVEVTAGCRTRHAGAFNSRPLPCYTPRP